MSTPLPRKWYELALPTLSAKNAEVIEAFRSHSDDGVGLLNDYAFSTKHDHGTRAFCGHRKGLIPGRFVFVLSSETCSVQQTRSQWRGRGRRIPSIVRALLYRMSVATEFNNGAHAYSTGTTVPNWRA